MPLSKHYIVQLCFECWLAPWEGDPGMTTRIEDARRFNSRKLAEEALQQARKYRQFPNAFVDVLLATVI